MNRWPPVIGVVISLLCLVGAMTPRRKRGLIDDLSTSKAHGVFIGFVELNGTAVAPPQLRSVFAAGESVAYEWTCEQRWSRAVVTTDSKGTLTTRRKSGWKPVAEWAHAIPFLLREYTGDVLIWMLVANFRVSYALRMSSPYTAWRRDLLALHGLLDSLGDRAPTDKNSLRAEVIQVAAALNLLRNAGMVRFTKAKGARTRILEYLKQFVDVPVTGVELEVVSGIHEYPRRIRELRVQDGYVIATGVSREDLKTDEYVLENESPNPEEAAKWQLANRIRKSKGSEKERMLRLLQEMVGKPVSGDQLLYVSKGNEMRRVRELRTEAGWRVTTKFTGQPQLPMGWYVLETLEQAPVHDRKIPAGVYDAVLERDHHACRKCGWTVDRRRPEGKRQYIELHHIEHHKDGGPNNKENLVTLCNVCHDDAHRSGLAGDELLGWLEKRDPKAP